MTKHRARQPLFQQSTGARLMVVSSHDHGGSAGPLLGLLIRIMLRHAPFPVRVVRLPVQVQVKA
jgi:hypothetical protein